MKRQKKWFAGMMLVAGLGLFFMVIGGCGKKARPIPMDAFVPRAVKNLKIQMADNGIQLSWDEPDKDLRGRKLKDLVGYKVLKKFIGPGSDLCEDCPAGFEIEATLEIDNPGNFHLEGATLVWIDKDVRKKGKYVYRIVPFNKNGYDGVPSAYVLFKVN